MVTTQHQRLVAPVVPTVAPVAGTVAAMVPARELVVCVTGPAGLVPHRQRVDRFHAVL